MAGLPRDTSHAVYIQILRRMSPDAKLRKMFELNELAARLFLSGLSDRYPYATEEETRRVYLERISRCYNSNY
jgi:hypothetical protein